MQLESLKMFVDVVETGSFSRAAQLNHVTQSAVSQQIRALETRYEQRLLSRSARQVTPTPAGERLFRGCKEILARFSEVEGEIREDVSTMDLLRATFPAGTVTGTPKVRAMEIIDSLEPSKRGIYAGAVGYLGFNGNMDLAIAIRTAVVKDKQLHAQAAAGIVADSVPALEWMETQNKAKAVLKAAEMVMDGLDTIAG